MAKLTIGLRDIQLKREISWAFAAWWQPISMVPTQDMEAELQGTQERES